MIVSPIKLSDLDHLEIRLLNGSEADTAAYRKLRTKIRNSEGARNFADSYTREDELNEHAWTKWCTPTREHCIVGTFDRTNDRLVSIMMITAQGPKTSLVAEWEATWVEPDYRGSGIAKQAYIEVQRISHELGYQHAIVFVRDDNRLSRDIRESQGFSYLCTKKNEHWADGSVADTNLFILDIDANAPVAGVNVYERAIRRLETTLDSMNNEVPFVRDAIIDRLAQMQPEYPLTYLPERIRV